MSDWKNGAAKLRRQIFLEGYTCENAHFASAFSCVEILYALYMNGVMRHDPKNPAWPGRDRLILSKGHGSLALYAALHMAGYFQDDTFSCFAKPGSILGGEPSLCVSSGIEASTGSLGHGLSIGVGMALANQVDRNDVRTYVLLGDGECEEGSVWEAVMAASRYELDHLIVLLDENGLQKMNTTKNIMNIEGWKNRFAAFGWDCLDADGHDVDAITQALQTPPVKGLPRVLIAHTVKGKGCSLMESDPEWHWRRPKKKELKMIMQELGLTQEDVEACKKHI